MTQKNKKKSILYISDVNDSEPIFHSQVVPHITELRKTYNVILMGMSRNDKYPYDYSYHSVTGDYILPLAYINFIKQKKKVRLFLKKNNIQTIYSRGSRGGLLGVFIKKQIYGKQIQLINDVRADVLDEHKNNPINKINFWLINKYIFNNSEILFFVSNYLKTHYISKFNYKGCSEVCPTFVPNDKFNFDKDISNEFRRKLGFSDNEIVLLYSGNLAKWQNVEYILKSFSENTNNKLRLLILTKNKEEIINLVHKINKREFVTVMSVNYSEIQNYYYAADFGLLVRDNIPTNINSAPTKFSEYINSGLEIIGTKIKSDYCDFLINNKMDKYMVRNKNDLTVVFNSIIERPKKNTIKLNQLSDIIKRQDKYL